MPATLLLQTREHDETPRPLRPPGPQNPSAGPARLRWGRGTVDARQHRYTVLIVDDESDIAESFQDCIERGLPEVRVLTATTGLEALNTLEREPVDLLVTDFRMPGMDGLELLARMNRIAPGVPRIVISAYPLEVSQWGAERHHMTQVFSKPIDPADLLTAVGRTLAEPQ